MPPLSLSFFFFFNDTATTEIYTLSLHDALPISRMPKSMAPSDSRLAGIFAWCMKMKASSSAMGMVSATDRKSTRLNSSHGYISYAVFCLKKKKKKKKETDNDRDHKY